MTNKVDRKTNQELVEELETELESEVVTSIDSAEQAPEVEAIHPVVGKEMTDRDTDLSKPLHPLQDLSAPTGGDRDIDSYLAQVVGEEAIGGTTPTPDQNVVEDLATSVGIEIPDQEILHTNEILEHRDSHRWELDPQSSEDYAKHRE